MRRKDSVVVCTCVYGLNCRFYKLPSRYYEKGLFELSGYEFGGDKILTVDDIFSVSPKS